MEGFLARGLLQRAWVALDRDVDLIKPCVPGSVGFFHFFPFNFITFLKFHIGSLKQSVVQQAVWAV